MNGILDRMPEPERARPWVGAEGDLRRGERVEEALSMVGGLLIQPYRGRTLRRTALLSVVAVIMRLSSSVLSRGLQGIMTGLQHDEKPCK
jgi:hypothetical protein